MKTVTGVIDLDLAHIFDCESEDSAAVYVDVIENIMGHKAQIIYKPEAKR